MLDLSRYEVSFDEPFDTLDVSPWGPGTRWIAHTPWSGDFGAAHFINPRKGEPFKVENGILQIEMRRKNGKWQSGLLSSGDRQSRGFLQSGGYFEARAKLPGGPGVWPAFWLGSNGIGGAPNPEIDVIEYYGASAKSYMATTHIWQHGKNIGGKAQRISVPPGSLQSDFHTYGVSIDPVNVIFYMDRREVAREATKPEYLQPLFLMVNLAAGGGWPTKGMPDPSIMYVDYIRAYRLKP
jgi:beta-glucanase (GH16 family)